MNTTEPAEDPRRSDDTELYELAAVEPLTVSDALEEQVTTLASTPDKWPQLAAYLQWYGQQLHESGTLLAQHLAAYSAKHPEITVPADSPCLLGFDLQAHLVLWDAADTDLYPWPPDAYGHALMAALEVSRTELDFQAVPVPETGKDTVVVLVHLVGQPEQRVRAYVGGVDMNDTADMTLVFNALRARGISVGGIPQFWRPVDPGMTFVLERGCSNPDHHHDTDPTQPAERDAENGVSIIRSWTFDCYGRRITTDREDPRPVEDIAVERYMREVRGHLLEAVPDMRGHTSTGRFTSEAGETRWLLAGHVPDTDLSVSVYWTRDDGWMVERANLPGMGVMADVHRLSPTPVEAADWIRGELTGQQPWPRVGDPS